MDPARKLTPEPGPLPGTRLPYFDLADTRGQSVTPWRFRGRRNLVLVFVDDEACQPCLDLLRQFAERYREYQEEEAEVLAIARLDPAGTKRLSEQLNLPFPLLADASGTAHARYGADGVAVYVTDRFGEVQERWLSAPEQEEVLSRLRYIGILCPE